MSLRSPWARRSLPTLSAIPGGSQWPHGLRRTNPALADSLEFTGALCDPAPGAPVHPALARRTRRDGQSPRRGRHLRESRMRAHELHLAVGDWSYLCRRPAEGQVGLSDQFAGRHPTQTETAQRAAVSRRSEVHALYAAWDTRLRDNERSSDLGHHPKSESGAQPHASPSGRDSSYDKTPFGLRPPPCRTYQSSVPSLDDLSGDGLDLATGSGHRRSPVYSCGGP